MRKNTPHINREGKVVVIKEEAAVFFM